MRFFDAFPRPDEAQRAPLRRQLGPAAAALTVAGVALVAMGAGSGRMPDPIYGFDESSLAGQHALEDRYLALPAADRIRAWHRELTAEPHVAGSPRNRALAVRIRDAWRAYGLDEAEIVEHEVLLPYPVDIRVEMVAPRPWAATMREPPLGIDPATAIDPGPGHHAYSASGDVTAPLVYAGAGHPGHYDWLEARGIDVRGRVVLVRHAGAAGDAYRGYKAWVAEQRGAAAILMFADPRHTGSGRGAVYPEGPWAPDTAIERGSILYAFFNPGDPTTPGWASLPGARRLSRAEAPTLPAILSVPIAWRDARVLLDALGGLTAPAWWDAGHAATRAVGPGPATVRVRVQMDDRIRPIWTVIGTIRGGEEPGQLVALGNHRDAWTFGGLDPSSGTAALMEVARALGTLARTGDRPRRTIVLASWDAEEYSLASSTEWVEQHEDTLVARTVAYLNVDSAGAGRNFRATAVPSLNRLITEAAGRIEAPDGRRSLLARWRDQNGRDRAATDGLVENRIGGGSDYTPFLNFAGVPIADFSFRGPYGVYHSAYDTHEWVARHGDPGFASQTAMARFWGIVALRLANADVLPLDYGTYAARVREFLGAAERRAAHAGFAEVRAAIDRLALAAWQIDRARTAGAASAEALNRALLAAERGLLDPGGLPGRPWYRHQIYAPAFTHEPRVLPALADALRSRDAGRVAREAGRLAAALERAARALEAPFTEVLTD